MQGLSNNIQQVAVQQANGLADFRQTKKLSTDDTFSNGFLLSLSSILNIPVAGDKKALLPLINEQKQSSQSANSKTDLIIPQNIQLTNKPALLNLNDVLIQKETPLDKTAKKLTIPFPNDFIKTMSFSGVSQIKSETQVKNDNTDFKLLGALDNKMMALPTDKTLSLDKTSLISDKTIKPVTIDKNTLVAAAGTDNQKDNIKNDNSLSAKSSDIKDVTKKAVKDQSTEWDDTSAKQDNSSSKDQPKANETKVLSQPNINLKSELSEIKSQQQQTITTTVKDLPQTVSNLAKNVPDGQSSSAKIILQPEALGTVKIDINMQGNVATISIKAENPTAAKLIESQLVSLKENLNVHGIQTGNVDVGVNKQYDDSGSTMNSFGNHSGKNNKNQLEDLYKSMAFNDKLNGNVEEQQEDTVFNKYYLTNQQGG